MTRFAFVAVATAAIALAAIPAAARDAGERAGAGDGAGSIPPFAAMAADQPTAPTTATTHGLSGRNCPRTTCISKD